MSTLKTKKTNTYKSDDFKETIKHTVLFCSNVTGNNNKFYSIEIQKNLQNQFRIFTHYGRLGKTDVYEIRDEFENNPIIEQSIAEKEFTKILNKKLKGKKSSDDGIEKYEIVDVFAPTVGSENVRGKSTKTVEIKISKNDIQSSYSHPEVSRIIKQIIDENIHNISTLTSLKLTSNGFETPLGPVTKEHVQKAKEPLNILKNLIVNGKLNPDLKNVKENNNKYYSLIPHNFGHKIKNEDWILTEDKLSEEFELLDNLESAVQMGSALQDTSLQRKAIGTDIELLNNLDEIKRITTYINNSKAHNHKSLDIWKYKIKSIYKIKIPQERTNFQQKSQSISNLKELFHGSKNCNILSILKNGLIIPPSNSTQVSGRMFGDGLYFADNSTKSLNYCTNFWNKNYKSKNSNLFLFLSNVLLGKEFITDTQIQHLPKNFDSIHAIKGKSLHNDEYIVYNLNQATLTYLIEME